MDERDALDKEKNSFKKFDSKNETFLFFIVEIIALNQTNSDTYKIWLYIIYHKTTQIFLSHYFSGGQNEFTSCA